MLSSVVHPFPAKLDGNIPERVRRYPDRVLGVVVLMWGATPGTAAWVASRIGGRLAGVVVALLLAWALIFKLSVFRYFTWFNIAMPTAFAVACLLGIRYGRQVQSPAAVTGTAFRSHQ